MPPFPSPLPIREPPNHKNPGLKDSLSKLKDAEQKLRANPSVKENLAKLKEAEQKFRDNPNVKENLSKLKDAEKKWREDAKSKQVCMYLRRCPSRMGSCVDASAPCGLHFPLLPM